MDSPLGLIIDDIKEISRSFSCVSFTCVKQSANVVAHSLARVVCSMSDYIT